jgi:hypothetical protein
MTRLQKRNEKRAGRAFAVVLFATAAVFVILIVAGGFAFRSATRNFALNAAPQSLVGASALAMN